MAVEPRDGGALVTLTTDGPLRVRSFRLSGPHRVVVDLQGARHGLGEPDFPGVPGSGIRGIRTSQFDEGTVRVVLDLERRVNYRVENGDGLVRVVLATAVPAFSAWSTATPEREAPPIAAEPPVPGTAGRAAAADTAVQPLDIEAQPAPDVKVKAPSVAVAEPPPVLADTTEAPPGGDTTSRLAPAPIMSSESAAAAGAGREQDVVSATVTRIAGSTLYLDRGSEVGLSVGDTLLLLQIQDAEQGGPQLLVLASATGRAVVEFVGAPVQITRGDGVRFVHGSPARGEETLLDVFSRAFPNGAAPARTSAELRAREPRGAGRLLLDLNAIQSTTTWADSIESGSVSRTFLTPTARLIGSVTGLPGGFRLQANVRGSYRYATGGVALSNRQSLRAYEVSLDRSTDRVEIRLGRFYSPYESFSGYWDGGVVRVGSKRLGAGMLVGFQPDAYNEGLSLEIPKFSIFVDAERRSDSGGYRADWSVHRLQPRNGLESHTFLGWSQRVWWRKLTLSNELQVDQNPTEGSWTVTEFQTNAMVSMGARTQVYGRLSRRQPYYFWLPEEPFSYLRDGAGVGLTVGVADAVVGGDVTFNHSDLRGTQRAFSGSIQMPDVAGGWSSGTYATWWSDRYGSGASLSPTLSRSIGDLDARFGYRYYWSESAFNTVGTHGFDGTLVFPAGPGLRATIQGSGQWGGNLRNLRLYSSLWKTF